MFQAVKHLIKNLVIKGVTPTRETDKDNIGIWGDKIKHGETTFGDKIAENTAQRVSKKLVFFQFVDPITTDQQKDRQINQRMGKAFCRVVYPQ